MQTRDHKRLGHRSWLPVLLGALGVVFSLYLSEVLVGREEEQIGRITQTAAIHIHRQIESELEGRMLAIDRISERWATNGTPTKTSWDAEAKLYVRHYPGIQAVVWADPSFRIRWVIPFEYNQTMLDDALNKNPGLQKSLEAARDRNRPVITETIDLPRGGKSFHVYSPIYLNRSNEFHGYTGGIFRTDKLFKLILANVATEYSISITDGLGNRLFLRDDGGATGGVENKRWGQRTPLEMKGVSWSIRVWPSTALVKANRTPLPFFVLLGGAVLAALLGGILYLLQLTRLRAERIERVNVTLRRQMNRRKTAESALRETSARLHMALRSSGMGTWRLDLEHRQILWDDYMHPLFGLSPGSFHGEYHEFLEKIHPEDRDQVHQAITRAIESSSDYDTHYRVLLPGADVRFVASRGRVQHNEIGRTVCLTGVCWDVTERKKSEEMERYAEVLKKSNQELERFAYVASHDLKSPLNNIVRYTDLLLHKDPNTPEDAAPLFLERMHKAAVRMATLIDGLLDYSRAETEAQKMEAVNLHEIFEEITLDLESHIQTHRGTVEIKNVPAVTGDRLQLRQLFQNLIANAVKFHAPGKSVTVVLSGRPVDAKTVEIEVADNGIGIDAKYQEVIFKPFNRLHRRDEYEGSGIGLATCQRIIQRHGGMIKIHSKPGEGTTFIVTLRSALPPSPAEL